MDMVVLRVPPARTRVGATVEPFLIRTPEEAERFGLWLRPFFPRDTIEQLTPKEQQFLLTAFSRNSQPWPIDASAGLAGWPESHARSDLSQMSVV
jgi:hypothetical protein